MSVRFEGGKMKSLSQIEGILNHNEKEQREKQNHRNSDIDKTKTEHDFSYRGLSVAERMERIEKVLATCKNYKPSQDPNNKNAKVLLHDLVMYPPYGLSHEDEIRWTKEVGYPVMVSLFDENRIVDMDTHVDEVHRYFDPIRKINRDSMVHTSVLILPVDGKVVMESVKDENGKVIWDEEKDEEGNVIRRRKRKRVKKDKDGKPVMENRLNAKLITGKRMIQEMNKRLEAETQRIFGIPYIENPGAKRRPSYDPEVIKRMDQLDALNEAVAEKEAELAQLEDKAAAEQQRAQSWAQTRDDLEAQAQLQYDYLKQRQQSRGDEDLVSDKLLSFVEQHGRHYRAKKKNGTFVTMDQELEQIKKEVAEEETRRRQEAEVMAEFERLKQTMSQSQNAVNQRNFNPYP